MMSAAYVRIARRAGAGLLLAAAAGCATTAPERHAAGPKDPYESFNRKMFAFNDTLDTYALKPVATAYTKVIPSPVRTGVHNFFGNFSDAWSAVNQLLQGKPGDAGTMTLRVLTNTTIGIAGLFDVASNLGLERKSEDLGQTLGVWGLEPGPYLVLPLFGSSDIRDTVALPADTYVSPALLVDGFWKQLGIDAIGVIDTRAGLLGASQMLDELAFDRYTFMRDAYVTRRRSLVYDGNPPELPDQDDDGGDDSKQAPAPAGAASGAQNGLKPVLPSTTPASGAQSSQAEPAGAALVAAVAASAPTPAPVPASGVAPAPLPASSPVLPVPPSGPVPVPNPPASGAHA